MESMIKQPCGTKAPHYSRTRGFLQLKSSFDWSFSNLAAMLRMNLLTYRDLWAWLDKPFEEPNIVPPVQEVFLFEK